MVKKKIPRWLQPTLWSVKVENLDLKEDKVYIINQVLAYGGWRDFKWLFKTYTKKTIRKVFIHQPLRIYNSMNFNFTKEILLRLNNIKLDSRKYVRYIYQRPSKEWWEKKGFCEKVDPASFLKPVD